MRRETEEDRSEKTMISTRDVIVCRGIWYVTTLLSLLGLSISLNLIWPPGESSSSQSRFLRDGAVSATTFYAVTLLRYLFFTDPPSTSYKDVEFSTSIERLPQIAFSQLALLAVITSPLLYTVLMKEFLLSVSLFTVSLFTGGVGLIQLSEKFRMETRHDLLTLFLGWLFCLFSIYMGLYGQDNPQVELFLLALSLVNSFAFIIMIYNIDDENSDSASPLPR